MSSLDESGRVPPRAAEPAARERQPWGLLASLAWYVLIFEIASRAYDTLVTASDFAELEAHNMALHVLNIVASWAKTFVILAFAVRLTGIPMRRYLGWVRPRASDITLGVLAVVAVNELADLLAGVLTANVADYRTEIAAGTSPWWYVVRPWPAIIFAPAVEESFFRGFLWLGVQSRIGNWGALLVSSAMFVVPHDGWYHDGGADWPMIADLFVSGLSFGWLRWRSGGSIAPMLAHALFNALEAPIAVMLAAVVS